MEPRKCCLPISPLLPVARCFAGAAEAWLESAFPLWERVEGKQSPLLPTSGIHSHPARAEGIGCGYSHFAGAGRSVAGKRSSSRERSLHGSWRTSLCLFLARAALGCSASCCGVARLPLPQYLPFGSHQAPCSAARRGQAGGAGIPFLLKGAVVGLPSGAFLRREMLGRFGVVLVCTRYRGRVARHEGKPA